MDLTLPPEVEKIIADRIKAGMYRSAEDVISAAIFQLDENELLKEFAPGELSALIAEGERGPFVDGEAYFAKYRARRASNSEPAK